MSRNVKTAFIWRKDAQRQPGMTLVELMIAMAIFAVGMAMVAAAFPTAIRQSQYAMQETLSQIICENAVAICQTRLKDAEWGSKFGSNAGHLQDVDDHDGNNNNDLLNALDRKFPDPVGGVLLSDSRYGWLLLGRRMPPDGSNDFQFVVVPYISSPAVPNPQLVRMKTFNTISSDLQIKLDYDSGLPAQDLPAPNPEDAYHAVGSAVIRADTGEFAYISKLDDIDTKVVILTNNLGDPPAGTPVWIVPGAGSGEPSPAIGCMVFRTALQP